MLILFFHFSKLKRREVRARPALGLTPYGCFYLDYYCDALPSYNCGGFNDSKDVYLQLENENEPQEISKWRGKACF